MYISGGENVYPAEIEAALIEFPGLAECAVIGVPDERWGEVGHLFIASLANSLIDEFAVVAFLESRLARYKMPKHITTLLALPRNGAGNLIKAKLREAAKISA